MKRGPGQPKKYTVDSISKNSEKYFKDNINYTITGYALALGFSSRTQLYEYEKHPEYTDIIKRGRLVVENGYELALRGQYTSGAIFALKNMGWTDKETIVTEKSLKLEDLDDLTDEIKKKIKELGLNG